ncbi:MAG: hypothetical protein WCB36_10405, partial [Burkholderiales bacterium]
MSKITAAAKVSGIARLLQPSCIPLWRLTLLSIIEAAGWPIWTLIIASIISFAIIVERFRFLRAEVVAPKDLLVKTINQYKQTGVTSE